MSSDNAVGALGNSTETAVNKAAQSGQNIFSSIAAAIGLDLSSLSMAKILYSVILLIALIAVSKISSSLIGRAINRTRLTEGLKKFLVKAIRFVFYFLSILIFCDSLGIPVTTLLAVFSLLGLAVSLSIQTLLSNIMSGVSLLMLKPFVIGDYIETDVSGVVINIGLFYTEILTVDNKKVFIPNETIIASKLINYNAEPTRRIDVSFNAEYDSDINIVKQALLEAVNSVDELLHTPEPIIGIADFGESAVVYDVRVWTATENYFAAKYKLMEAVAKSYKVHGIKMAYNRLNVKVIDN